MKSLPTTDQRLMQTSFPPSFKSATVVAQYFPWAQTIKGQFQREHILGQLSKWRANAPFQNNEKYIFCEVVQRAGHRLMLFLVYSYVMTRRANGETLLPPTEEEQIDEQQHLWWSAEWQGMLNTKG